MPTPAPHIATAVGGTRRRHQHVRRAAKAMRGPVIADPVRSPVRTTCRRLDPVLWGSPAHA